MSLLYPHLCWMSIAHLGVPAVQSGALGLFDGGRQAAGPHGFIFLRRVAEFVQIEVTLNRVAEALDVSRLVERPLEQLDRKRRGLCDVVRQRQRRRLEL